MTTASPTHPGKCQQDKYEGSQGNNLKVLASTFTATKEDDNVDISATLCEGDEDWYFFQLSPGVGARITLDTRETDDYDIEIYSGTPNNDDPPILIWASNSAEPFKSYTIEPGPNVESFVMRVLSKNNSYNELEPYYIWFAEVY